VDERDDSTASIVGRDSPGRIPGSPDPKPDEASLVATVLDGVFETWLLPAIGALLLLAAGASLAL
jgi:hypothetical protein